MQDKRLRWDIIAVVIAVIVLFAGDNIWQQIFGVPFFKWIADKIDQQPIPPTDIEPTLNPWEGMIDIQPEGMEIISRYDCWFTSLAGNRWQIWRLDGMNGQFSRLKLEMAPSLQLLNEFVPTLSSDQRQIAFAAGQCTENGICNRDIYIADINGSDVSRVTDSCNDDFHPSWSPDGKYIAYFSGSWDNPECLQAPHGIWVFNLQTRQHIQLTDQGDYNPVWSPNGKFLAYNSISPSQVIKILDFEGCDGAFNNCQTWIAANTGGMVDSPGWANDNTIVFSSNYEGDWEIYQVPVITGQTLVHSKLTSNDWDDQYPAVSEDGKILVWQAFPYYQDGGDSGTATEKAAVIYVMDLASGKFAELITGIGNSRDGFLTRKR